MNNKTYEISVITPVHNIRTDMFEKTFASMKNQTYGFENIEWIVVLHNSDETETAAFHKILDGFDNVRIFSLNNDVHSPSSPRNYGLERATGTYVGFLDGDDRYTSWCIEKVLGYLNENGADLCHFRRMVELEKEGGIILNELVLWDQTRETILVNRDNWDGEKLFVGTWGMCTSKIYRRDFLLSNRIFFDDTISFAEDYDFSISAYALAKNICLAPQMIGYVYYVNSGSLVQTTKVTNEVLLKYAKGFKKLFDKGLSCGIYMNDSMGMLLLYEAIIVNVCKDIDPAVRREIVDMLEPYIRQMKPIASSKIYAGGRNERMNTLPAKILLGEELLSGTYIYRIDETAPQTVLQNQQDTLAAVLKLAMQSDYAKHYHFTKLLTLEDFRDKLPITDYHRYQPMIDLTVNIGEKGIFTDEVISCYAVAHDAAGRSKRIPFTEAMLTAYVDEFRRQIGSGTVFTMLESLPYQSSRLTMDIKYTNTVMGLILTEFTAQNAKSAEKSARFVTPAELRFPKTLCDFDYVRMLFALSETEIDTVYAPNAWVLYAGVSLLYRRWRTLCDDIEAGTISRTKDIPADIVAEINDKLQANPERAAALREIFAAADGMPQLTAIWPKLIRVFADSTGSYAFYKPFILPFLGDGVAYSNGFLADEFGFYGYAEGDDFRLAVGEGFFEFLPFGADDEKTCFAHELKEGEEYTVVISNKAGLFRFKTDMLLRCVKADADEIIVRKLSPIAYDLRKMCGIREEELYDVVKLCSERLGIFIADFTLTDTPAENTFTLVLEPGTDDALKTARDADLTSLARECTTLLNANRTEPVTVGLSLCEPETHFLYRDVQMMKRGVLADGIAPCHITDDPAAKAFFT